MLNVLTIRIGDVAAHGHIQAEGTARVFCGEAVPDWMLQELEWEQTRRRSAYINKQNATCPGCLAEWHSGRRSGFLGDTPEPPTDTNGQ